MLVLHNVNFTKLYVNTNIFPESRDQVIQLAVSGLAAAQSNAKVKEIEGTVKSLKLALEETEQKLVDQYNREKLLEEQANARLFVS